MHIHSTYITIVANPYVSQNKKQLRKKAKNMITRCNFWLQNTQKEFCGTIRWAND